MVAVLVRRARRDHDDRDVARALVGAHVARELESVHARHFDVEQDAVGFQVLQLLQRVHAILRARHLVAFAREHAPGDLAHGERIVHHHDERSRRRGGRRGARGGRRDGCRGVLHPRVDDRHLAMHQLYGVENQHHLAVAEHGRPRDSREARELRADRLHDDLAVADDLVHADRGALQTALEEQHRDLPRRHGAVHLAQERVQRAQRIAVVLPCDLGAGGDLGVRGRLVFLDLLDHDRGHRVDRRSRAQHHGLRHRERERQRDREARPSARGRYDLDPAAEGRDLVPHDVETDAAARDLAHLGRGREPGGEDELRELRFRELDVGRDEPCRHRLLADALEVEARAVVGHGEHHLVAALHRVDRDLADVGLAGGEPLGGRLETVRDRIAQQVLEGRGDLLEHGAVELDARALELEVRLLVELLGGLAHDPVEAVGEVA